MLKNLPKVTRVRSSSRVRFCDLGALVLEECHFRVNFCLGGLAGQKQSEEQILCLGFFLLKWASSSSSSSPPLLPPPAFPPSSSSLCSWVCLSFPLGGSCSQPRLLMENAAGGSQYLLEECLANGSLSFQMIAVPSNVS